MSYKRYIKRGGKLYGPYIYESHREGNKVVASYKGKLDTKVYLNINKKKILSFTLLFLLLFLLVISSYFLILNMTTTGKVTFEINPIYQENQTITGNLNILLNENETIPDGSMLKIKLNNQEKLISFSDITKEEEKAYPIVYFTLKVTKTIVEEQPIENITQEIPTNETQEQPTTLTEQPTTPETQLVEEQPTTPTEGTTSETTTETTSETPTTEPQTSETTITGEATSENEYEIQGEVSKDKSYSYNLEVNEDANVISDSVYTSNKNLTSSVLSINKQIDKISIITEYSETENNKILVNLEQFGIKAEKGSLQIELIYNNETLAQQEASIDVQETNLTNITEQNLTQENVTLQIIQQISDINIIKNTNYTLNLTDYFSSNKEIRYSITQPENITTIIENNVLTIIPNENYTGTATSQITANVENSNLTNNEFNIIVTEENISLDITTKQVEGARVGEPVKFIKKVKIDKTSEENTSITIEIPAEAENISVTKIENEIGTETGATITGNVISEQGNQGFFIKLFSRITGNVVEETPTQGQVQEVKIEDNASEYNVEFSMPAPTATENNLTQSSKSIIVSGPDTIHYTNVTAFTFLPKEVDNEKIIKLYWYNGSNKQEASFDAYDTNDNNLIDYIEWQVPSLSNQTYELSMNIINVHSYPSLHGNWTVEFNTTGTADLTITATNEPNYTLQYTRWTNYSEDSNSYDLKFIEVRCGNQIMQYRWQGTNCNENECSVSIANYSCNETAYEISKVLTAKEHVLKFNFGGIEAYAYNNATTAPGINFTSPTPANATSTTNTSAEINISITGASDLSGYIWNWNNTNYSFYGDSLVLMMNFDNVSAIGENSTYAVDVSKYSNNGTLTNGVAWTTSGKYGSAMNFDGVDDFVNVGNSSSLNPTQTITLEAWAYKKDTDTQFIISKRITGSDDAFELSFGTSMNPLFEVNIGNVRKTVYSVPDGSPNLLSINNWYHIVGTYNGSELKIYIDGQLKNTTTGINGSIDSTIDTVRIGWGSDNTFTFNGSIDEVRIYNRSLSAAEIKQQYYSNLKKYDSDKWEFYSNQSNLSVGTYTYYGWVNDTAGNVNSTETRSLTINAADLTPPFINFTSPTPDNASTQSSNSIYVNVTSNDTSNISTVINFDNSLISWWRFENNANDSSTYGNNVTCSGANCPVYTSSGKFGGAYTFNHSQWFLSSSNASELKLPMGTAPRTITTWFKLNTITLTYHAIAGYGTSDTGGKFYALVLADKFKFWGESADVNGGTSLQSDTWYFGAITYNNTGGITVYLNGVVDASGSPTLNTSDDNLYIGKSGTLGYGWNSTYNGNQWYFNGSIDDVMIFNRSLSADEVAGLYANTSSKYLGVNYTGLSDGSHTFKAYSQDLAGNVNATELRTIALDSKPPAITLISPDDAHSTTDTAITFSYNVSDTSSIANCSLIIDNTIDQTDTTITKDTTQSFTKTLSVASYTWSVNCTDAVNNMGNSSTRSLTITQATTPSSGGGGSSTTVIKSFTVSPLTLDLTTFTKEVKTVNLKINNTGNTKLKFSILSSLKFIVVPADFELEAGQEKEIELSIYSPDVVRIYEGEISVKTDSSTKRIPLTISVEKSNLFDISASVLPQYKKVKEGEDVFAKIQMIKMKGEETVDIKLDYSLRKGNEVIASSHETLAIETKMEIVKNLLVPANTKPGEYNFHVELTYDNITVSSADNFYVIKEGVINWFLYKKLIYILISAILIAILIIFIVIKRKKRKKDRGNDYYAQAIDSLKKTKSCLRAGKTKEAKRFYSFAQETYKRLNDNQKKKLKIRLYKVKKYKERHAWELLKTKISRLEARKLNREKKRVVKNKHLCM